MKAAARIEAGVCGFVTTATVTSEDGQYVTFDVRAECDKIRRLGDALNEAGSVDAYLEISPSGRSVVLQTAQRTLTGCCAGCVVPAALYKAMQVAAGLALPRDIAIKLTFA